MCFFDHHDNIRGSKFPQLRDPVCVTFWWPEKAHSQFFPMSLTDKIYSETETMEKHEK